MQRLIRYCRIPLMLLLVLLASACMQSTSGDLAANNSAAEEAPAISDEQIVTVYKPPT